MKNKRTLIALITLLLLALVVSSVAAQGRNRQGFDDDRDFCAEWGRRGGDVERCEEMMQQRAEMMQQRGEALQNRGERLMGRSQMMRRWMEDGRFGGGMMGASWWAELAEESGLTVTEIRERLAAGESIQDILTAAGLDADAIIESLVNQARERHALAVGAGRMTQEQADAMLETIRERLRGDAVWCSPRRCA